MKNKFITILIIFLCILLLYIMMVSKSFDNSKNSEYDYTNKIFSSFPDDNDYTFATIVVFTKNGKYYHFTNTHDEKCILRANTGMWKKKDDGNIYVKYDKAIYYDGGELVKTDDANYFNVRRINYKLVKRNYSYDTTLEFVISKGTSNSLYKNYLTINNNSYFPIYEFETEEELYKKLEEMYGEVYTMLVDNSIETIDDTVENIDNSNKEE